MVNAGHSLVSNVGWTRRWQVDLLDMTDSEPTQRFTLCPTHLRVGALIIFGRTVVELFGIRDGKGVS